MKLKRRLKAFYRIAGNSTKAENIFSTFQLTFFEAKFFHPFICSSVQHRRRRIREDVTIIEFNKYFHAPELLEVAISEKQN